jgi:lysophospholipid acyltransferase (LPLAT)-like uncharacterized protein
MAMKTTRKIMFWLIGLFLIIVALFCAYTWITLHWSYAKGERAGYVQKLSKKGWICKTWEGEMAMVAIPGSMPEKFYFSVRDESVVESINKTMGKRVVIVYEQHKGVPTNCFGETEYFAKAVKLVE